VWIAIVATTHSLRTHGYTAWATGLITLGAVFALIIAFALWRTLRARTVRKIPIQAVDDGAFPVPPLPSSPRTRGARTEEKADA
jgi:NADH-quinone oxidoreductase subunit H